MTLSVYIVGIKGVIMKRFGLTKQLDSEQLSYKKRKG